MAKRPKQPPPRRTSPVVVLVGGLAILVGLIWLLDSLMGSEPPPRRASTPPSDPAPLPQATDPAAAPSEGSLGSAFASGIAEVGNAVVVAAAAQPKLVLEGFEFSVVDEEGAAKRAEKIQEYLLNGTKPEREAAVRGWIEMGALGDALLPGAIEKTPVRLLNYYAEILAARRLERAMPALAKRFEKDGAAVGKSSLMSVAVLGTPAAHDLCLALMKKDDPKLRAWGWEALSHCPQPSDLSIFLMAMEKGDFEQRRWAIESLAKLAPRPEIRPQLSEALQKGLQREGEARWPWLEVASRVPPVPYETILNSLYSDFDPAARAAAMRALGTAPETCRTVFETLKTDENLDVKVACLQTLTAHPQFDAVPKLLELMGHENGDIRWNAHQALIAAFGEDRGFRPQFWSVWIMGGEKENDEGRRSVFDANKRRLEKKHSAELLGQSASDANVSLQ